MFYPKLVIYQCKMALWCYHFFDADKHNRNIKIARLFEQCYGWNLFSLFLWVIDHKNCANIILFHQSTSSFNKICNTTKEMMCCEPDEPMTTHCLQAIHRCVPKFGIVFHQSTSSFNKICNTAKEMIRSEPYEQPSSLSVDKMLYY